MADPRKEALLDAVADPAQTIEADGDRLTLRPMKDLERALDIIDRHASPDHVRPVAVLRPTRFEP